MPKRKDCMFFVRKVRACGSMTFSPRGEGIAAGEARLTGERSVRIALSVYGKDAQPAPDASFFLSFPRPARPGVRIWLSNVNPLIYKGLRSVTVRRGRANTVEILHDVGRVLHSDRD